MTTPQQTRVKPTLKQRLAMRFARMRKFRHILTGGAMSTAKSYGLAFTFLNMAMQFPRTRYGIFRRNRTVLKRTTYKTFEKVAYDMGLVEGQHYKANRSDLTWTFGNGAEIIFMQADETKDPDFNQIKGLELTAVGIDEVNELVEAAYDIITSRVGRENRNGEPQFVLSTCNPTDNWVKDRWYTPWVKGKLKAPYLFIPSLPEDNPYNSAEYLEALRAMPLQFVKRYVEGNWDYVDDASALFPNRIFEASLTDKVPTTGIKELSLDIARQGDDRSVISYFIGGVLIDQEEPDIEMGDKDAPLVDLAEAFIAYAVKHSIGYQHMTIDANGMGAGVLDILRSRGYYVRAFVAGEAAEQKHDNGLRMFDMVRSERFWGAARAMERGELKIWRGLPTLEVLRRELFAHGYEITNLLTKVDPKDVIKKKLGKSPDYADSFVMGYWPPLPEGALDISTGGTWDEMYGTDDDKS